MEDTMRQVNQNNTGTNAAFNVVAFDEILAAQKREGIHLSPAESLNLMLQVTGGKSPNASVDCIRAGLEKTGKIKSSDAVQAEIIKQLLS
jgi:hypothetical protein